LQLKSAGLWKYHVLLPLTIIISPANLADRKSDFTLLVFDKSEFLAELMNENDSFWLYIKLVFKFSNIWLNSA